MVKGNICIVEDEEDIVDALKTILEREGFSVVSYASSEQFFLNRDNDFRGLYLVDWSLPGDPGLKIVSHVREEDKFSPIFMMSAYNKREDVIEGLKAGADDYLVKPFNFMELLQRVENAYLKYNEINEETSVTAFRLLPEAAAFLKDGKTVNLTTREFVIFDKLYKSGGDPVTREELITCFDKDEKMTIRNIDVHIFSLRKKIKECKLVIDTVWGKGYRLVQ